MLNVSHWSFLVFSLQIWMFLVPSSPLSQSGRKLMSIDDVLGTVKSLVHGAHSWEEKTISKEAHGFHSFTYSLHWATFYKHLPSKSLALSQPLWYKLCPCPKGVYRAGGQVRKDSQGVEILGTGHQKHFKVTLPTVANENATRFYKSGAFPGIYSYVPKPAPVPILAWLAVLNWHTQFSRP